MRTATSSVNFFIVARSSFDFARAGAHAVIRNPGSNPRVSGDEIHGGEGGIRTLGTVLPVQPLSRRLPSAGSATSPQDPGGGSRIRTCGASPPSGFQDRRLQPL